MTLVEECCYDRTEMNHMVNLFDMHHKYADVMHLDEVLTHINGMGEVKNCLLYTSPSPRDRTRSRMPSSA